MRAAIPVKPTRSSKRRVRPAKLSAISAFLGLSRAPGSAGRWGGGSVRSAPPPPPALVAYACSTSLAASSVDRGLIRARRRNGVERLRDVSRRPASRQRTTLPDFVESRYHHHLILESRWSALRYGGCLSRPCRASVSPIDQNRSPRRGVQEANARNASLGHLDLETPLFSRARPDQAVTCRVDDYEPPEASSCGPARGSRARRVRRALPLSNSPSTTVTRAVHPSQSPLKKNKKKKKNKRKKRNQEKKNNEPTHTKRKTKKKKNPTQRRRDTQNKKERKREGGEQTKWHEQK